MNFKNIYLVVLPLLLLVCSLSAIAQDYEIQLEPPSKVGDRYLLSAVGSERLTVKLTSGETTLQNTTNESTLELTAEATVLTVDTKGRATSKSFTITSTKLIKDGTTGPLLPNGSIVLAKLQDGHTLFEMNGKPVQDEVAKALSQVIALHSGDSISDEAMFGSSLRRRAGESWNLNLEAITAFVKGLGGQASKDDISGSTTLEKVENNHLIIHGTMTIANALLPLSSDFNPEKGAIHSEFTSKLPLSNSDGSIEDTGNVLVNINGIGRDTPNSNKPVIRINITTESHSSFKMTPIVHH